MDRFQAKYTASYWKDSSVSGKVCLTAISLVSIGFVVSTALVAIPSNTSVDKSSTGHEGLRGEGSMTTPYEGTGGPDHFVLGDWFLMLDVNSNCDESLWALNSNASSSMKLYSSSTPFGSTFQFDFTPTGVKAANISLGRLSLYEVVYGDNSYEHLSVKDILTGRLVDVFPSGQISDGSGGRINMGISLSTTTENAVRVEEILSSETSYKLEIQVNEKSFTTEEITAINYKKYDSLYIGLIDGSKDLNNRTGIYAPALRICH